jgi:DNA-binding NarL/FixJ family response regulator
MVDSTAIRTVDSTRAPVSASRKGRVLIADRRRLYREALAHLLGTTPGIERIVSVASFEDAVAACRTEPLDAALVHVDTLPGGWNEAAARLIDERPQLRVAIVAEDGDLLEDPGPNGHAVVSSTDPLERLVAFVGAMATEPQDHLSDAWRSRDRSRSYIVPTLTRRELEVLEVLAAGLSTEDGAKALHVSPLTIRSHVKSILGKLGVHSKLEAVTYALRLGLIKLPPPG